MITIKTLYSYFTYRGLDYNVREITFRRLTICKKKYFIIKNV